MRSQGGEKIRQKGGAVGEGEGEEEEGEVEELGQVEDRLMAQQNIDEIQIKPENRYKKFRVWMLAYAILENLQKTKCS